MAETASEPDTYPVGQVGRYASGWPGMLCIILTEGALFVMLLYGYYYFAAQHGRAWLPIELPSFRLSAPNTVILLLSSVALWWGERGARKGSRARLSIGLFLALVLGAVFVSIQCLEWIDKPFSLYSDSYGSIYFTMTGFHMAHVLGGLIVLAFLLVWSLLGYFDSQRHSSVTIGAAYWHFVDAVWLALFFTIYVTPHLR